MTGDGVSIVITPLLSLMHDQVEALHARGIAAAQLGSNQTRNDQAGVASGKYRLVYMTPERAQLTLDAAFWRQVTCNGNRFVMLAVDEAHCVSEWGHDFRPAYKTFANRLRSAIAEAGVNVPVVALTATATPAVRSDVANKLQLRPGQTESVICSFDRPNLQFSVRKGASLQDFMASVAERAAALGSNGGGAIIVYAQTKKNCENLAQIARGLPALAKARPMVYHAGCSPDEREATHNAFIRGECNLVIATVAFGMGIDKHDVRSVFHFGSPASLEAYYQEAGRAGRDGYESMCELWWSDKDWTRQSFLQSGVDTSDAGGKRRVVDIGKALGAVKTYTQTNRCRRTVLVEHFAGQGLGPKPCGTCDNCRTGAIDRSAQDFTEDARLLVAAVEETGCRWTLAGPTDCLLGRKPKGRDYEGLRVFGRGKHKPQAWWRALGAGLVEHGWLEEKTVELGGGRSTYNKVVLARKGLDLLANPDAKVALPASNELLSAEKEPSGSRRSGSGGGSVLAAAQSHPRLFEALKKWRTSVVAKATAEGRKLPSYVSSAECVLRRHACSVYLHAIVAHTLLTALLQSVCEVRLHGS